MIVVDTSALIAIAQDELGAARCVLAMVDADEVIMSAATMAEALVVAGRRGIAAEMAAVLLRFEVRIVPVTAETARRVAAVYDRWGKGVHPAGLNFCDCFAYDLATRNDCPLLFIGEDFSRTDVLAAL